MATLPQISYLSRDWLGIKNDLLDYTKYYIPEFTDFNESEVGIVIIELFAYVGDNLHYYLDRKLNEAYLPTAIERADVIKLCNLIDYQLSSRTASTVDLKFTMVNPLGGNLTIPIGTICQGYSSGKLFYFETTSGLTITAGGLTGTVGSREGLTYSGLALGTSDGTELQSFTLSNKPLLKNQFTPLSGTTYYTARLYVDEGDGPIQWNEVDTFVTSTATNKHYIVNLDDEERGVFEFGDNINGKIPANNAPITTDVRLGGGRDTNVAAGTITAINSQILFGGNPVSISVTNPKKASGGDDQETLDHARIQAPRSLRALYRAVTAEDFITLAQQVQGVAKASVKYTGTVVAGDDFGAYTYVYIAPNGGGLPSSTLKSDVQTYLNARRLITTFPNVQSVRYLDIYIQASVRIAKNYVSSQVQSAVEDAVLDFYKFDNLQLGVPLRISDFYHLVDAINGVNYLNIDIFSIFPELAAYDGNSANSPITVDANVTAYKKSFYDFEITEDQTTELKTQPAIGASKATYASKITPDVPAIIKGESFDRLGISSSTYNIRLKFENETEKTIDVTGDGGVGGGYTINTVLTQLNKKFTSFGWPVSGYASDGLVRIKDTRSNYLKYSNDLTQSGTGFWTVAQPSAEAVITTVTGALIVGSGQYSRITTSASGVFKLAQSGIMLAYPNGVFSTGGAIRTSISGMTINVRVKDGANETRWLLPININGSGAGWTYWTMNMTVASMSDRNMSYTIEPSFTASGQFIDFERLWLVSGVDAPDNDWLVTTTIKDMPVYTGGKLTVLSDVNDVASATFYVFGFNALTNTVFSGTRGMYNLKIQVDDFNPITIDVTGNNGTSSNYTFTTVKDIIEDALDGKCVVSGDGAFLYLTSLTTGNSSRIKIMSTINDAPDREATGIIWGTTQGIDREYLGFAGTPFKVTEYNYSTVLAGVKTAVTFGNVGTVWTDGYLQVTMPLIDSLTLAPFDYKAGDKWRVRIAEKAADVLLDSQEIPRNNNRIALTYSQDT